MTASCRNLLLVLALLGVSDARAQPLPVRDQFLLGVGFLALEPVPAAVLARGDWRVDAVWTASNSWALSPQVNLALRARDRAPVTLDELRRLAELSSDGGSIFIDGEVSRLAVALRRGFGRAFEVEIRVPFLDFGGGTLDGAIEDVHARLDLGQDGRGGAVKDRFLISTTTRRGDLVVLDPPSLALGDVVVGAKLQLSGSGGRRTSSALRALVKLPTGDHEPLGTSGATDFGLQFLLSRDFDRWSIHGAAGVRFLGASERLGLESQRLHSLSAAAELSLGRRNRLLLQLDVVESPFSSYATARIGEEAFLATLGLAREVARRTELFVAVTENIQHFNNSADISLHFGLSRTSR